jgi:hypothetical protein
MPIASRLIGNTMIVFVSGRPFGAARGGGWIRRPEFEAL